MKYLSDSQPGRVPRRSCTPVLGAVFVFRPRGGAMLTGGRGPGAPGAGTTLGALGPGPIFIPV